MTTNTTRDELSQLRSELRELRWYLGDGELAAEISEWLDESCALPTGSVVEFVEDALAQMDAEYEMFYSNKCRMPEEGFPDECKGCDGYGSACPMLRDETTMDTRERMLAEAETERERKRVLQLLANKTGCARVHELIDEWEMKHAELVQRGTDLHNRALNALRSLDAHDDISPRQYSDDDLGLGLPSEGDD